MKENFTMAYALSTKTCPICHDLFTNRKPKQPYCSTHCSGVAQQNRVECTCQVCTSIFWEIPARIKEGRGKYCSRPCHSVARRTQDPAAHFWSQVDQSGGPDMCWPWTGGKRGKYGRTAISRKGISAHRRAYELTYGPIPPKKLIRHKCDNPPCCNPRHLMNGSQKQNVQDALDRGRWAIGERHHGVKLTEKKVVCIRRLVHGGKGTRTLADQFHVSMDTIRKIAQGKLWKHVL